MTEPTDVDHDVAVASRRRFLRDGGALMGGAVLTGGLAGSEALAAADAASASNVPPSVPEWMKAPGDPVGSQLYGTPSPFEKGVVRNVPKNAAQYLSAASRTPLQDLDGIITPNGLFYERHHGGIPAIDPAQHRLMLHGLVDKPLIFSMNDIRRFPTESRIHFLECSGNPGGRGDGYADRAQAAS
jgi:sulfane dehydrogenase subunit SoxC